MKTALTILILCISTAVIGQIPNEVQSKVDSLQIEIEKADHDSTKVKLWINMDNLIYRYDPELDYEINKTIEAICAENLSTNLHPQEKKFFMQRQAAALNIIGIVSKNKGDYGSAIDSYLKSLKLLEELRDTLGMGKIMSNIGVIYTDQKDFEKAIQYHSESLEIRMEYNDLSGIANSYNNLGATYQLEQKFEKADSCYAKSAEYCILIDDDVQLSRAYNNIGSMRANRQLYDEAIEYYEKSLKLAIEADAPLMQAESYRNLGITYQLIGDDTKTISHAKKALKMGEDLGLIINIEKSTETLYKVYKKQGKTALALSMHEKYIEARDSIRSINNQKEIIRQEYRYTYEKEAQADSIKAAEQVKVKDAEIEAEKAISASRKKQSYFLWVGLVLLAFFGVFIFNRFKVSQKQRQIIKEQKEQVDVAFEKLEEKNNEILDSIAYAKRIQTAILPPDNLFKRLLPDAFVLYRPKDIVAGDFYWIEQAENKVLFAAADCTGHGVPGAMVSVICNNGLNRSVKEYGLTKPADILDKTRDIVVKEFEKSEEEVKDGMDIALCSLRMRTENDDKNTHSHSASHAVLEYAGAHNSLWIIRKGATEVEEIKADKQPIGKFSNPIPYSNHEIEVSKGDCIYIFSDGFADQFGGVGKVTDKPEGKKFKSSNFKKLLFSVQTESMERQKELIDKAIEDWMGDIEQLDDICVMGVRV